MELFATYNPQLLELVLRKCLMAELVLTLLKLFWEIVRHEFVSLDYFWSASATEWRTKRETLCAEVDQMHHVNLLVETKSIDACRNDNGVQLAPSAQKWRKLAYNTRDGGQTFCYEIKPLRCLAQPDKFGTDDQVNLYLTMYVTTVQLQASSLPLLSSCDNFASYLC